MVSFLVSNGVVSENIKLMVTTQFQYCVKFVLMKYLKLRGVAKGGGEMGDCPPIGDPSNFLIYEIDFFVDDHSATVCLTRFHLRKTIIHDIIRDEIE